MLCTTQCIVALVVESYTESDHLAGVSTFTRTESNTEDRRCQEESGDVKCTEQKHLE